jgi:hypothetical protein
MKYNLNENFVRINNKYLKEDTSSDPIYEYLKNLVSNRYSATAFSSFEQYKESKESSTATFGVNCDRDDIRRIVMELDSGHPKSFAKKMKIDWYVVSRQDYDLTYPFPYKIMVKFEKSVDDDPITLDWDDHGEDTPRHSNRNSHHSDGPDYDDPDVRAMERSHDAYQSFVDEY